jgi:hypothetical protein
VAAITMGKTLGIMGKMKNRNNTFQKSKMLAIMGVCFLNAPLFAEENLCLISWPLDTLLLFFCMMLYEIELTQIKDQKTEND